MDIEDIYFVENSVSTYRKEYLKWVKFVLV
jgi:hypothetical protein